MSTPSPLKPQPDASGDLAIYLKAPARYSGNNFQVEVTKCDAYGTLLPTKITGLSSVYTSWKRVYVERDYMFRRGGVLYSNAAKNDTSVILYKNPNDTRWDNLNSGDKIAIFDTASPYEGAHDEAYVGTITDTGSSVPHQVLVTLMTAPTGGTPYALARAYTASPADPATHLPTFALPVPPAGTCAGVGVIYSTVQDPPSSGKTITDTSPNQINGTGSAFYDADMRNIEQPFDDAYVEFIGLRSGMGAVPYLPQAWFDAVGIPERARFSQIWFTHYQDGGPAPIPPFPAGSPNLDLSHNYFHLIGASFMGGTNVGITNSSYDYTYIFAGSIEALGTPAQAALINQDTTSHEFGHQFGVNYCSGGHDTRSAWCDGSNHCNLGGVISEDCVMNSGVGQPITQIEDGVSRFCVEDALTGDPICSGTPRPGAVRTDLDPQ